MEKREQLIELLNNCIVGESVSSTADKILFLFDEPKKEEQVLRTKTPPLPPKNKKSIEIGKLRLMLDQAEVWINEGEIELYEKHLALIVGECRKYGA